MSTRKKIFCIKRRVKMIYESKEITLKDGRHALLRAPSEADSAEMVEYMKKTAAETEFLSRYPDEVMQTAESEREYLRSSLASEKSMMMVCEIGGEMAGNCQFVLGRHEKMRHRATVMIALLRKFWGLGIGGIMFAELEAEAKKHGASQLELTVVEGNERAIALYRKMGFDVVGRMPRGFVFRDGTTHDEIYMVKIIG